MQIATAINASASMTGESATGPKNEPLATRRLLSDELKLDSGEDNMGIEDWLSSAFMKVNVIYPGAQCILEWTGYNPGDHRE